MRAAFCSILLLLLFHFNSSNVFTLTQASKVRIHDITVNVPADVKFRRLNVSFYDPSDYCPPAPFLFKPALALILDTSTTQSSESGVGRLLTAFTECFWKELSAGG